MKRIKNIGKKIGAIWFKYVKNPILRTYKKNKEKRELNRKIANIRKDFEDKFKIKVDDLKEIMYPKGVITTNNPYDRELFLNQELEKARKLLSDPMNGNKHVFFYEPEIVEIHNETTYLLTKDLNEIKKIDAEKTKVELRKQEKKLASEEQRKADYFNFNKGGSVKNSSVVTMPKNNIYDEDYGKKLELRIQKDFLL
jgi:hypothetical protein